MRWMRFFMFLIVLLPSQVLAQQHSEAVCLLLQQQIDRYANQKSNPNYRSARREYDKYCYAQAVKKPQPTAAAPKVTPVPASPVETKTIEPVISADAASNTNIALEPADTGATQSENAENAGIASKDTLNQTDPVPDSAIETAAPAAGATDVAETNLPAANTNAAAPRQVVVRDAGSDFDALLLEILLATPLVAANIVAFLLVVFLLTNWLGLNLPGFKGVFAEYKLNRILRWRLSKEYQHFRKLRLTNDNNESTVIDHLVLSPYGIFVIMVKSYRGRINGSESLANWTRDYLGNSKQFMNPLHQNFKNMQALKQLLELPGFETMHSVIAFARLGQFASELPANITYIDTTTNYIKQCTERCINDEQLARFSAVIQQVVNDA